MTTHITKIVKIDRLEPVMEDFHNFFLGEISKVKDKVFNFLGDLTNDIVHMSHLLTILY